MTEPKSCSKCGEAKPADRDHFSLRGGSNALRSVCKACQSAYLRDYRARNLDAVRAAEAARRSSGRAKIAKQQRVRYDDLGPGERYAHNRAHAYRYKYGITVEEYDALLLAQGRACAICVRPPDTKPLSVDHDHETGAVRGLLCVRCNTALGTFGDNAEGLRRALAYLSRSALEVLS